MSYGLEVYNSRGDLVIGEGVYPYRYTVIARQEARPVYILTGAQDVYGWGLRVPELTPTSMIAMDRNGARIRRPNGSIVPYNELPYVRIVGGVPYLVYQSSGEYIWTYNREFVGALPKIYVIDNMRPAAPATGYGINVFDAAGRPVLNSSTPLVKVISNQAISTPATLPNASETLLFVHSHAANRITSYIDYGGIGGGGSTPVFGGGFTEHDIVNNQHRIRHWLWDQEIGQGSELRTVTTTMRVTLAERPD